MDPILNDLIAEQAQVDALVDGLTDAQWESNAAYCTTWKLKDVICHVAFFDLCAMKMLNGEGPDVGTVADAISPQDEHFRLLALRDQTGPEILGWWRQERTKLDVAFMGRDPKDRVNWAVGLPMSVRSLISARMMELWAHSVDIYDALGIDPVVKDRIASTLFLSWQARPNAYRINGLELPATPMYLELILPSGRTWAKGDLESENYVKGSAKDWALCSIHRRNWMDTGLEVQGDEARRYAYIVQTYAGGPEEPPTAKRPR